MKSSLAESRATPAPTAASNSADGIAVESEQVAEPTAASTVDAVVFFVQSDTLSQGQASQGQASVGLRESESDAAVGVDWAGLTPEAVDFVVAQGSLEEIVGSIEQFEPRFRQSQTLPLEPASDAASDAFVDESLSSAVVSCVPDASEAAQQDFVVENDLYLDLDANESSEPESTATLSLSKLRLRSIPSCRGCSPGDPIAQREFAVSGMQELRSGDSWC